jgi:hypothetical protein
MDEGEKKDESESLEVKTFYGHRQPCQCNPSWLLRIYFDDASYAHTPSPRTVRPSPGLGDSYVWSIVEIWPCLFVVRS